MPALLPRHGKEGGDPLAAAAFSHTAIRANAGPEVQAEFAPDRRELASRRRSFPCEPRPEMPEAPVGCVDLVRRRHLDSVSGVGQVKAVRRSIQTPTWLPSFNV